MIKIFCVIVNWNGLKDTLECLNSIEELTNLDNLDLTICLIDNGSRDESGSKLKNYKSKRFNIIDYTLSKNLGFTGGFNYGIRLGLKANCDYILLLNNDTLVDQNMLANLVKPCESNKEIGIVGPRIYFAKGYEFKKDYSEKAKGKVIWANGGRIDWNNVYGENIDVDKVDEDKESDKNTFEVDFVSGACMLIRREVIEKIGLLNDKYYLYLEDMEFCQRAKNSGWKLLCVPRSIVWHKVSQSSAIGGNLNDYYIIRNRLLFGYSFAGIRAKFALFRESIKLLIAGRKWQRKGVLDFYTGRFGKGSWET